MAQSDQLPLAADAVRHALTVYRTARQLLAADASAAAAEAANQSEARRSRTAFLAFVAFAEGDTHLRKRLALACEEADQVRFTAAQRAVLVGHNYFLNRRGDAVEASQNHPLVADLRFSLQMMAMSFRVPFVEAVNGAGWAALLRTVLVAKRLRQPESAADLDVPARELASLTAATAWYNDTTEALLKRAVEARRPTVSQKKNFEPVVVPVDPLVRLPARHRNPGLAAAKRSTNKRAGENTDPDRATSRRA